MKPSGWTAQDLGDLTGRRYLVTGASRGLGWHTALELARHGAQVILACRGAATARDALQGELPDAQLEAGALDLADLASVRALADALLARGGRLDGLILNAGIMAVPVTLDGAGHERHMAVNHLGHFALLARLMPLLLATPQARVVGVTSNAHTWARPPIPLSVEPRWASRWMAYARSKLANLLTIYELHRRARGAGLTLVAAGAHPGYARTDLQFDGPRAASAWVELGALWLGDRLVAQPAAMGALPILYAAAAPEVVSGGYYGPDGPLGLYGHPHPDTPSRHALDVEAAQALWAASEAAVGVRVDLGSSGAAP